VMVSPVVEVGDALGVRVSVGVDAGVKVGV
jgi:hypothetical protein